MRYATLSGGKRLRGFLVLEGAQSDDRGTYAAGDMVLNPPGSEHRVWTDQGCVVLLHWDKPVEFLDQSAPRTQARASSRLAKPLAGNSGRYLAVRNNDSA